MLRQSFMNKYKPKLKYDTEKFQREDEEYLLKLSRPVKDSSIKCLSAEKMNKFMNDILTNKKFGNILYDSNADKEISLSQKSINIFEKQIEKYKNIKLRKEKLEPSSVVKKRSRREAYVQMRTEIDNFTTDKKNYINKLMSMNYKKYLEIKKEVNESKKSYFDFLRKNRINSFKRAYNRLKIKIDDNNGKIGEDDIEYYTPGTPLTQSTGNYYIMLNNYKNVKHSINFPKIKCNIKDVFSRLFNNKVLLTSKTMNNISRRKKKRSMTFEKYSKNLNNKIQPNPKVLFNLKNVLMSNGGKEFTIKVTDEIFKKCFDKYSGGPEMLRLLKEELQNNNNNNNNNNNKTEEKNKNLNLDGYVNFYKLADENGNTYLHISIMENYPDLVKYFIDKGANINKKNNDGNTPLHIALKQKNMEIIGILLKNKAKLDIPNNDGDIPFEFFDSEMKKKFGLEKMLVINPAKEKYKV